MPEYMLHLVSDNPWNERELDLENVERIAASIAADRMLETPLGRIDPAQPAGVQLAFGHHRLAAYRKLHEAFKKDKAHVGLANPWARIPVEVRPIDDRQMARYAIIENHHRSDPSAIEKARALLRLTTDPAIKVSQAEAGALFGLGQTGVSHLVHLLDLPADVQALVTSRELPEVPARHLVPLVKWRPDLVSKIAAQAVSESENGQRATRVDVLIDEALRRNAPELTNELVTPWQVEWPSKPISVPNFKKEKGQPAEVPACKGCPFNLERGRMHYCLRQACFDLKQSLWSTHEVERTAARLGIAPAAPGETLTLLYPTGQGYSYNEREKGAKLLRGKLPELRIAARARGQHGGYVGDDYGVVDVLGSRAVALATVDLAAVTKWWDANRSKDETGTRTRIPAKLAKRDNESPAQTERRKVAERELAEERALERMAYNRSRADVLWLVEHTAALVAERTVAGGGMLLFAIEENRGSGSFFSVTEEMREWTDALAKRTGVDKLGHSYIDGGSGHKQALATSTPEMDRLRRQYLAYRKLSRDVASGHNATAVYAGLARARKVCESVATDTFGVELPAGWDTPPVHHTPINCWTCGRFSAAGAGKLTQADTKAGWVTQKDGAVHCPEHAGAGIVAAFRAKPVIAAKPAIAAIVGLPVPARKPAPRAAAVVVAKAKHVRSHTRPAPKKVARRKMAKKGRTR